MTCSTRVSTRSVLSPVRDRLGTTNGSKRTNESGVFSSALPRTRPTAAASPCTRQPSCSSTSTRTCNGFDPPRRIIGAASARRAAREGAWYPARRAGRRTRPHPQRGRRPWERCLTVACRSQCSPYWLRSRRPRQPYRENPRLAAAREDRCSPGAEWCGRSKRPPTQRRGVRSRATEIASYACLHQGVPGDRGASSVVHLGNALRVVEDAKVVGTDDHR